MTPRPIKGTSKLPYVMSVVQSGGQYQVVIGSNVSDYYATISSMAGLSDQETGSSKKQVLI